MLLHMYVCTLMLPHLTWLMINLSLRTRFVNFGPVFHNWVGPSPPPPPSSPFPSFLRHDLLRPSPPFGWPSPPLHPQHAQQLQVHK